jgi:hypothetical protein
VDTGEPHSEEEGDGLLEVWHGGPGEREGRRDLNPSALESLDALPDASMCARNTDEPIMGISAGRVDSNTDTAEAFIPQALHGINLVEG